MYFYYYLFYNSRIPVKHRPYSDTTFGPLSLSQTAVSSKSYTEEAGYKRRHQPSSIAVITERIFSSLCLQPQTESKFSVMRVECQLQQFLIPNTVVVFQFHDLLKPEIE